MTANNIKLLVFDMGHVFVDFEWEEVCLAFCESAKIERQYFDPILKRIAALGYERGHIATAGLLEAIYDMTGMRYTNQEFTKLWNHTFRENEEMAVLLQKLKTQRPLYLLSNTNEEHWRYLQETYSVSRHFDQLVLSYEIGHVKPQPEIYQEVLKRSGFAAEECLFVDDLPENIAAGRELGMNVIHFQGVEDLKDKLTALGFEC
jgi:HAD superfamily hydrolase (TIGR01509 family)